MFDMSTKVRAGHKDAINKLKTVWKALEDLIHHSLGGTSIVPYAKKHLQPLKQAKRHNH